MRTFTAVSLAVLLTLTGCATLGIGTGGDTATRIIADIGCLTALVGAGVQVMGDPSVNGASTATDVLVAIGTIGASNIPATVLAACKDTMGYAAQDAQGLVNLVSGSTGTTGTGPAPLMRASHLAKPPKAPSKPTVVQVMIPR